jgi:hypothetical protein
MACPSLYAIFSLLLVIVQQVVEIVLIGGGAIGAKGIGRLLGTKDGHILLAECQIDRRQRVERRQLAWIDLDQADMRHREGGGVRRDDFLAALALLLLHAGCSDLAYSATETSPCPSLPSSLDLFFSTSGKTVTCLTRGEDGSVSTRYIPIEH